MFNQIDDFATQIRILSLQARVDDSVTVDQLQHAFELSTQIQDQLRTLMHQVIYFLIFTKSEN